MFLREPALALSCRISPLQNYHWRYFTKCIRTRATMPISDIVSNKSSVSSLVKEFTAAVDEAANVSAKEVSEALSRQWNEFMCTVRKTPHSQQEPLVSFLQELRREKSPQNQKGEGVFPEDFEYSTTWDPLPLFGWEMRDAWNHDPNDKNTAEEEAAWVNQNGFAARITARSKPNDAFDFSLYCIWTLRDTLEEASPDAPASPISSTSLQSAAVWMLYASHDVWKRSVDGQIFDGKMAREGSSLKGKQWRGYSQERWNLWAERFMSARESCEDDETKRMLDEVIKNMRNSEHESRP